MIIFGIFTIAAGNGGLGGVLLIGGIAIGIAGRMGAWWTNG
jgi:hypothetical protein